jgi:hypothetical protein
VAVGPPVVARRVDQRVREAVELGPDGRETIGRPNAEGVSRAVRGDAIQMS